MRARIGALSAGLIERRQAVCVEQGIGLTDLYNQVEDGAWVELRDLHTELDEAVAVAYDWPAAVAHDPLEAKARLAALHASVVDGADYVPFAFADTRGPD